MAHISKIHLRPFGGALIPGTDPPKFIPIEQALHGYTTTDEGKAIDRRMDGADALAITKRIVAACIATVPAGTKFPTITLDPTTGVARARCLLDGKRWTENVKVFNDAELVRVLMDAKMGTETESRDEMLARIVDEMLDRIVDEGRDV